MGTVNRIIANAIIFFSLAFSGGVPQAHAEAYPTIPYLKQPYDDAIGIKLLSDEESKKCKIGFRPDGKITDSAGNLYNASKAPVRVLYVMDEYGTIYFLDPKGTNELHHNSILANRPVAAAGEAYIQDGVLLGIDMSSGHYRPKIENTLNFLGVLNDHRVPLKKVQFENIVSEIGDSAKLWAEFAKGDLMEKLDKIFEFAVFFKDDNALQAKIRTHIFDIVEAKLASLDPNEKEAGKAMAAKLIHFQNYFPLQKQKERISLLSDSISLPQSECSAYLFKIMKAISH